MKGGGKVRARVLVARDDRTEVFFDGVAVGMSIIALFVVWLA